MVRLGVTGGIGSGKSYVCRMLSDRFGIPVYNCDINARVLTLSDPDVMQRLEALVEGVYDEDGELDKKRLADFLFASDENARKVNQIIHPAVRRHLHQWYAHCGEPVVVMESAILYESGFDDEVDRVLFVDAPLELRIQRTMERDGLSRQEVLQRIDRQNTELVRQCADYVVVNDGNTPLEPQLLEILKSLNH